MKVEVARFRIPVVALGVLRRKLGELMHEAGFEKFSGSMMWRYNDGFSETTKVCAVAYRTGAIVVSGYGHKFDLTRHLVKTYDMGIKTKK